MRWICGGERPARLFRTSGAIYKLWSGLVDINYQHYTMLKKMMILTIACLLVCMAQAFPNITNTMVSGAGMCASD